MAKKKFFISFDYDHDESLKHLLVGQSKNSTTNEDSIHSDYLDRHSYWEGIGAENIKLLDEQLVFLSSGALIFSISVVDLLGPYYNFHWLCVIWTLFTASLLSRLLSFFTGEKNAEKKIAILDQNMIKHLEGKSPYKLMRCVYLLSIRSYCY